MNCVFYSAEGIYGRNLTSGSFGNIILSCYTRKRKVREKERERVQYYFIMAKIIWICIGLAIGSEKVTSRYIQTSNIIGGSLI